MISMSLLNPLAGLDLALHGSDHLIGWGQPNRIDNTLLYVTGFDPSTNRFLYQVNERFGDQRSSQSTVVQQPFQLSLTMRYTVGPDRQRDAMLAAQAAARGGAPGGRGTPGGQYAGMVRRYAPNIFKQILDQADTLKLALTDGQKSLLQVMSDSLAKQIDTLGVHLQERIAKAGNNVDNQAMLAFLRPVLVEAQDLGGLSIKQAQLILSKDQWAKLPERMRNPAAVFGPGGGGRGGRP